MQPPDGQGQPSMPYMAFAHPIHLACFFVPSRLHHMRSNLRSRSQSHSIHGVLSDFYYPSASSCSLHVCLAARFIVLYCTYFATRAALDQTCQQLKDEASTTPPNGPRSQTKRTVKLGPDKSQCPTTAPTGYFRCCTVHITVPETITVQYVADPVSLQGVNLAQRRCSQCLARSGALIKQCSKHDVQLE